VRLLQLRAHHADFSVEMKMHAIVVGALDGPRYDRVCYSPLLGDRPCTFASLHALTGNLDLVLGELPFAPELYAMCLRSLAATIGPAPVAWGPAPGERDLERRTPPKVAHRMASTTCAKIARSIT
jgi:hypothetical protein